MQHENFRVTYDGVALQHHEIDVRILAPALLAVGDVLEHANRVINDSKAKVSVNVKGSLKTGSVNIDFAIVQGFMHQAVDFLTGNPVVAASTLLSLLGFNLKDSMVGLLSLIKRLRGRKIKKIETSEHSAILFFDEEQLEVALDVLRLFRDYDLRQSLEGVLEPLEREGIDVFAVGSDTEIYNTVKSSEVEWFRSPPPMRQQLGIVESEASVQIERIEFSDGNKWRFFDGSASFYAVITDETFLRRISSNEAVFSRGDVLRVIIQKQQFLDGDKLKSDFKIIQVLEHMKGSRQIDLPLS
jgi:hypothetical protein